jgi:hypothetical protein
MMRRSPDKRLRTAVETVYPSGGAYIDIVIKSTEAVELTFEKCQIYFNYRLSGSGLTVLVKGHKQLVSE